MLSHFHLVLTNTTSVADSLVAFVTVPVSDFNCKCGDKLHQFLPLAPAVLLSCFLPQTHLSGFEPGWLGPHKSLEVWGVDVLRGCITHWASGHVNKCSSLPSFRCIILNAFYALLRRSWPNQSPWISGKIDKAPVYWILLLSCLALYSFIPASWNISQINSCS